MLTDPISSALSLSAVSVRVLLSVHVSLIGFVCVWDFLSVIVWLDVATGILGIRLVMCLHKRISSFTGD